MRKALNTGCRVLSAAIVLVLLFSTAAPAEEAAKKTQAKLFKIINRPADSLIESLKIYTSKDAVIIADERTNSLIVRDYPENLEKIEQLIESLDVPAPQCRIYVNFMGRSSSSNSGIYGKAVKTKSGWVVGVKPDFSTSSSNRSSVMNVMAMSGTPAFIKVGERSPYTTWFYNYALGRAYIHKGVIFREVSTGFYATPVIRDKNITLSIAPGISYFDGKKRKKIIFREAETEVYLKDGQSAVVGAGESSEKGTTGLISHIVGGGSYSGSDVFSMTVTVKIIKDY